MLQNERIISNLQTRINMDFLYVNLSGKSRKLGWYKGITCCISGLIIMEFYSHFYFVFVTFLICSDIIYV